MVLPSRENANVALFKCGRSLCWLPSGLTIATPSSDSHAIQSPTGDQSGGVRHEGPFGITCGDISAPTPTIAGCHGRSLCMSPATQLPSGDQVGDCMYSDVSRMGEPPTVGATHTVVSSLVAYRTNA